MCGIAGIINLNKTKFDYETFCLLGIANDSRGGDSCGIYIDGNYSYGTKKENKYFSNYFVDNDFLLNLKESQIALLHCRKASIGAINEKTAQPIIISNNGNVEFVLIHNGTIYNYEELAKKYIPDIDISQLTDSQVLARIFYYKGYDVLNEYNGGTAFVAIDYRNPSPKILLYHGESRKYSYTTESEIERPLYYCINPDTKELVFSSIPYQMMVLRKDLNVFSLKTNSLLSFTGNSLKVIQTFSRKDQIQTKEYTYYNYYNPNSNICTYTYPITNFIVVDCSNNTYQNNRVPIHGKIIITDPGYIKNTVTDISNEIYFFNGIPLISKEYFKFLSKLRKNLKLTDLEFCKKFECLIRYLSIAKVFKQNNIWKIPNSPFKSDIFTGDLEFITSRRVDCVKDGFSIKSSYENGYIRLKECISDKNLVNLKQIEKECMSLMK